MPARSVTNQIGTHACPAEPGFAGAVLGLERQRLPGSWSQVKHLTACTCYMALPNVAQAAHVVAAITDCKNALTQSLQHRATEKKPRRIAALKGVNIVQAACGGWHCLAVSNAGQAYAWGGNEYGQCGVAQGSRDVPEPMPCLPQHKVQQVAAGGMHTCALTESGRVGNSLWSWGWFQLLLPACWSRHLSGCQAS